MAISVDLLNALPHGVRPLRRVEYDQLVAQGSFADERLELLAGVLVEMSPQDPAHADAVQWLVRIVGRALPPHLDLRVQLPLAIGEISEPEPDLAVVPARRYRTDHPASALLVIEVARTSQGVDLGPKAALYANAGVPEYWVVDLKAQAVVVYTEPGRAEYARRDTHRGGVIASTTTGVTVDLGALFG